MNDLPEIGEKKLRKTFWEAAWCYSCERTNANDGQLRRQLSINRWGLLVVQFYMGWVFLGSLLLHTPKTSTFSRKTWGGDCRMLCSWVVSPVDTSYNLVVFFTALNSFVWVIKVKGHWKWKVRQLKVEILHTGVLFVCNIWNVFT
jgi:hypothetical protein